MASPLIFRSPQCISCIRRTVGSFGERRLFPAGQQIRGKKKLARSPNKVNALLREDISGYGSKGTVISVTAGLMRNQFFPQGLAEYATASKLAELGIKEEDVIQLDTVSRGGQTLAEAREAKKAAKKEAKEITKANMLAKAALRGPKKLKTPIHIPIAPIEVDLLDPEEATQILSRLMPKTFQFPRQPITPLAAPAAPAPKISPSLRRNATVSAAATEGTVKPDNSIYGSVSTADIAAKLKETLSVDEEGKRVVIEGDTIRFSEVLEGEEPDRVKRLGKFEISVQVKGASNGLRAHVEVVSDRDV